MTVKERLIKYIKYNNLSQSKFEKAVGLSNGYVNNISKGIGADKLQSILCVYPSLNPTWLLTGEGEMLKEDNINNEVIPFDMSIEKGETIVNKNGNKVIYMPDGTYFITVPLVEFSVYAGRVNEYQEAVMLKSFEKEVTFPADHYPKGNYLAFKISGYSMDNEHRNDTPDGALVLARELSNIHWKDGFNDCPYGWIIISKSGMVFKDITSYNQEKGTITLHSRSQSPEFSDFELKLEDIFQIFKVIKRTF